MPIRAARSQAPLTVATRTVTTNAASSQVDKDSIPQVKPLRAFVPYWDGERVRATCALSSEAVVPSPSLKCRS